MSFIDHLVVAEEVCAHLCDCRDACLIAQNQVVEGVCVPDDLTYFLTVALILQTDQVG
jgi:hypothetical protein